MTLIQRTVWLLALIGWLAPAATAQMEAEGTLYTRTEDDLVRAVVQIQVSPDWHLYHTDLGHPEGVGKPLSIELGGEGIEWGEPRVSEPETYAEDPERGVFVNVHHGLVTIWALGVLDPGAEDLDALVYLEGLTCQTDGLCIPYEEELESEGAGSDKVFADFPDDLTRPGPAAASGPVAAVCTPTACPAVRTGSRRDLDHPRRFAPEEVGLLAVAGKIGARIAPCAALCGIGARDPRHARLARTRSPDGGRGLAAWRRRRPRWQPLR